MKKYNRFLDDNKDVFVSKSIIDPVGDAANELAVNHTLILIDLDEIECLLDLEVQIGRYCKS